jgi:carboxyl-terminal processing protease
MIPLNKTTKSVLILLLAVTGAAACYLAGLGTGLTINQATAAVSMAPTRLLGQDAHFETPAPATPPPAPTPTATISPQPSAGEEDEFDIFWEAWHVLEEEFYGELPAEPELPYAALRGVIAATGDQYTAFLDPVRAEVMRTDLSGSFEGIGATVRMRPDGKLEIVQPLPARPAIQAGLRAQDVILEVDGVDLQGMNLYEAISLIRGPAGTTVRLLVQREDDDQPFTVEVERARIELPVLESDMLESDIAYIKLNDFSQTATDSLKAALRDLMVQDPKGLVLDLRGNPGGYLSVAVEVSSQFVGDGPVLLERFKDQSERPYEAIPGGLALDIPLVVLVDGGSASASEIVAGAIQDTGRGLLVGTTTLGKGSVQMAHTLSDGSQLRVTIARWFTPTGRAIHGEGLAPDIEVLVTEEHLDADLDPQLERAIQELLEEH